MMRYAMLTSLAALGLWLGSRRIAELEATRVERARAVGELI